MIKQFLDRFFKALTNGIVSRSMPIILKQYNKIYSERWHPHYVLREEALNETVAYIKANMPDAMIKQDEYAVLAYASSRIPATGLILEFGVYTGSTINYLAGLHPERLLYGFDSFEGLPEAWSGWVQEKGFFSDRPIPQTKENVRLIKGWFDDSLPSFLAEHPEDVALIHVDSDLYSSAKTILTTLAERIRPGAIIVFNEYFNYPNWQQHEYRAFQEFCRDYSVAYEYLCWGKFEVAIRILSIETKVDVI